MKTSIVWCLIILFASWAKLKSCHAGIRSIKRLLLDNAVAWAAMTTTGKRIAVKAAIGIIQIANTSRTGRKVGHDKCRGFSVCLAGDDLKIGERAERCLVDS